MRKTIVFSMPSGAFPTFLGLLWFLQEMRPALAVIFAKTETRAWMVGHMSQRGSHPFQLPTEWEIFQTRDFTWQYLQSVRDGRPFIMPSKHRHICEILLDHSAKLPGVIQEAIQPNREGL